MNLKKSAAVLVVIIAFCLPAKAQNFEKTWFNKTDSAYGYYAVVKPLSSRIQGVLVLLDGYGGNATDFLTETKLHNIACANDFLTVCLPTATHLYIDSNLIETINTILKEVIKTYKVKKDQFVLGGHSSGGTIMLRYAELCKEKPQAYPIEPGAVFTVDSPVDVLGLYRSSQREVKKSNAGWWLGESQMIIDSNDKALGKPETGLQKYRQVSPFMREDSLPGNERFLKDVAYRTYHDADVNWYIQNRQRSLYETNIPDASELVNRLVSAGNASAEFIASKQPAKRSNGYRHPHSWSAVDEVDLIQWAKEKLQFYPDHITPFFYPAPENWASERILFPIDFAPDLPYSGFEDLRFAPGWGDAKSTERWAYTLLWWLDDSVHFTQNVVQQNLESYFTGLTHRRAVADGLNMQAFTNAKAEVSKVKAEENDVATYSARVAVFDAQVTKKPGVLYIKIHVKNCSDKGRTILLFEVSALDFKQPVWQQLGKINADFRCKK